MSFYKKVLIIIAVYVLMVMPVKGQLVRENMNIPDIPGYQTLKCDFHIHTVFSDGNVWPATRVKEAWMMGYDVISITDHIEYQPHKKYIPVQHNAGYEIAKPQGDRNDMIIIHGSEVTRVMPPGHLNAIFIKDATRIETERINHMHHHETPPGYLDSIDHQHKDYMMALEEAVNQGGFIFWNHPGWAAQAPAGIRMYDVHRDLIDKKWLKGIEVANWDEWYPEAFRWCLDYNLAMLSNSDIHETEKIYENESNVRHRPITLVFAREKTENGTREALEEARTAVWFNDRVIGRKEFVHPLCMASLAIDGPFFRDDDHRYYNLINTSDFIIKLQEEEGEKVLELSPQGTIIVVLDQGENSRSYTVRNFLVEPDKALEISLSFE